MERSGRLKSQPRGQNFQAQKPVERSSPYYSRTNKNTKTHLKQIKFL